MEQVERAMLELTEVSVTFKNAHSRKRDRSADGADSVRGLHLNERLQFKAGKVAVILGRSGTGKTTLLNLIMGFYREPKGTGWERFLTWLAMPEGRPDVKGRVLIDGKDITDKPPHNRPVGLVMQRFSLYPHLTVEDNITFPLSNGNVPMGQTVEEVISSAAAFAALGSGKSLDKLRKSMPDSLAGGQQQRVAIAKLFVRQPKVALFDEAFSHLDRKTQRELWPHVKAYASQKETPHCVLFVTHELWHAMDEEVHQIIVLGNTPSDHCSFLCDKNGSAFEKLRNDWRYKEFFDGDGSNI